MKGARQRVPLRTERIFRKTLIASALYAVLSVPHAYAQTSAHSSARLADYSRSDDAFDRSVHAPAGHYDGAMIRTQQRTGRGSKRLERDNKPPALQPVQQVDDTRPRARRATQS